MNILITGGAGYLGSVLTPTLLTLGHEVTVLDNFCFHQHSLLDCCHHPGLQIVRGDCRDAGVLKPLLSQADAIIALAAVVGAPACDRDRVAAQTTNLEAVETLRRLASRSQWILLPATNCGYGVTEKRDCYTEDAPMHPSSLYGITKAQAEEAVLARDNGLTLRLASVFGLSPRMRFDVLVNDFVYRAVHDRALVVFEGHFKRNHVHIRDVARVFAHALDRFDQMKGKPYNVGLDDANLTKIELCSLIKKHVPKFVYLEANIGRDPDQRDYVVSNARLNATGFKTEWSLDRGIRELIKGYTILRNTAYANV